MNNINKTFRLQGFSVSETRLCYMAEPYERIRFGARSPEHEENKGKWQEVFRHIQDAPSYFHDKELQKIVRDQSFLDMIAAMVDLPGDGTVDWLPTAALKFAELYRAEFKNEKPQMEEIRGKATSRVTGFIDSLKEGLEDLTEAEDQMGLRDEVKLTDNAGGDVDSVKGSENLPDIARIKEIFDALTPSSSGDIRRQMIATQHGLTNLAREIVRSDKISPETIKKLFTDKYEIQSKLFDDLNADIQIKLNAIVVKHLADNGLLGANEAVTKKTGLEDLQKALLDRIVTYAKITLVAPDEGVADVDAEDAKRRGELDAARKKSLEMAENLTEYEKELLKSTEYAKNREEYFLWLRGHRLDRAVFSAFDKASGAFSAGDLHTELKKINSDTKVKVDDLEAQFALGLDKPHTANLSKVVAALKQLDSTRSTDTYKDLTQDQVLADVRTYLTDSTIALANIKAADITPEIGKLMTSVWNQEPLMDYLEEQGFNRNHIVDSTTHLIYRSFIGKENASRLIDEGLGDLSTGMLIDLSEHFRDGIDINSAGALIEYFAKDVGGKSGIKSVNKKRFIDALHFVYLGETDPKTKATDLWNTLTGSSAEENVELSEADIVFALLHDEKIATHLPDSLKDVLELFATESATVAGEFVVKKVEFIDFATQQFKKMGKTDAEAAIEAGKLFDEVSPIGSNPTRKKLTDAVLSLITPSRKFGADSTTILEHLDAKDAPDKGFIDSARDLSIEAIGTAKRGATKWWEWLSSMPANYMDGDLSEKLLALDDRRQAHTKYASMIEAMLTSSSSGGGGMEENIEEMQELQAAQEKATQPLDIADGSIDNVEQAYILLQASKVVMDRLEKVGWSAQPEDVRYIAYWIAMKSEGGIQAAENFIIDYISLPSEVLSKYVAKLDLTKETYLSEMNAADRAAMEGVELTDATKQSFIDAYLRNKGILFKRSIFISQYIADHKMNIELEQFLSQIDINEENSDKHILDIIDNKHGIRVRPMAMQALMGLYRTEKTETREDGAEVKTASNTIVSSMRVSRWLIDRDGTEAQRADVRQALDIVLEGPVGSKNAVLDAFINRTESHYFTLPGGKGNKITVSVAEADDIVRRVQTHLTRIAGERQKAYEQLEEEELYTNPLEQGLRAGIETLQDLWSGDMVDKAKVIAAVVAGIYIIRKILTEGGKEGAPMWMKLAKWSVIGIPLLIVANSAIKNRTGRDYMGEYLNYMPKEERAGAMERFRRRSKEEQRYHFLGTNAGHESLRQLSGPDSHVPVKDLLLWREQVQGSTSAADVGHTVYSNGAPSGLNIFAIQMQMGPDATKEDAYKVAYLSFEALLTDVSTLRGYRGTVDQRAEIGADIVKSQYVDFMAYNDQPDAQTRMKARNMTMLDVIISESQTPATMDAIAEDRTFVEWFADAMGWSYDEAKSRLGQLGTRARRYWLRTGELLPELWENAWTHIDAGVTNIYDFYRKVKPRVVNEVGESADALWRLFLNTADAAGIVISKAPQAGEVVVEFVGDASEWTIDTVIRIYDQARAHSVIGNLLNGIESGAQKLFGANFASLLALRGSYQNDPEYVSLIAEFPRMADGMIENLSSVGKFKPELKRDTIKDWLIYVAKEDFGKDVGPDLSEFSNLNRYERMAIFEKMKRKAHSLVIAERLVALEDAYDSKTLDDFEYPVEITHTGWMIDNKTTPFPLADQIESSFGINTLALIATEKDWAGAYQEWVIQNTDTVRPPLEFLHFAVDWATMDGQTEHLIGSVEQFTKQFLVIANEEFKGDPKKLELYKHYLETIATNVVLEAAMGARNGQVEYGGKLGLKKADLQLLQSQATSMIAYFKTLRGFSPDARGLDNLDLDKFRSTGIANGSELNDLLKKDGDVFLSVVQDTDPMDPKAWPSFKLPIPKLSNKDKDTIKDPEALKKLSLDKLLDLLNKASNDTERDPIRDAFDFYATDKKAEWENLTTEDGLEVAFKLMTGVTDAKLAEMRTDFFAKFQGWGNSAQLENLNNFAALRSSVKMSPIAKGRIQDTLDKTAQGFLDNPSTDAADVDAIKAQITTAMKASDPVLPAYSVAALKTMGTPDQRKVAFKDTLKNLASLYKVTILQKTDGTHNPTVASDAILLIMEHLLYVGDDKSADTTPEKNTEFKKFKVYMQTEHGIAIPDDSSVGGVEASAKRMAEDFPKHKDGGAGLQGYLDFMTGTGEFGTKPGHLHVLNERLKGVQ